VIKELRAKDMGPERVVLASSRQAVSDPRYISLASAAANLEIPVSHGIDQAWGRDEAPSLREFDMSELLGRAPARLDAAAIGPALRGKRILVTGAGGTIGSELVRQIAGFQPEKLTLVDTSEYNLYKINQELSESFQGVAFEALLCDVRDRRAIFKTVETQRPELVFHAAALKHVPLVELNASIGAATNIIGTKNVADAVKEFGAKAMVQVSTDKAVNPVGMMGATKRVAELYCQMLDMEGGGDAAAPRFMTVRFGNVLDSSGSVIPLFRRQLRERMPLTVTHPEMTRYFMTIHEAVALILQSTQQAFEKNTERGLVFVLDMGEPIRIVDMAHRMIRLSGLQPGRDVKIQFVGARPGEKMHESLFDSDEGVMPSRVPGVFEARSKVIDPRMLCAAIEGIEDATSHHRDEDVRQMIMGLLQGREAFGAAAPAGAGRESLPADGLELAEFPATQSAPMAVATAARTRKAHLGVVK
jgi:O-antigen biosynthesis protein WbqV